MEKIKLTIQKVDNGFIMEKNNKTTIHNDEESILHQFSSLFFPQAKGRINNIEISIEIDDSKKKY